MKLEAVQVIEQSRAPRRAIYVASFLVNCIRLLSMVNNIFLSFSASLSMLPSQPALRSLLSMLLVIVDEAGRLHATVVSSREGATADATLQRT